MTDRKAPTPEDAIDLKGKPNKRKTYARSTANPHKPGPEGLVKLRERSWPQDSGNSPVASSEELTSWEATNVLNFIPTAQRTAGGEVVVLLVPEPLLSAQLAEVIKHREAVERGDVLPTKEVFLKKKP